MENIRPSADLRNKYNEMSQICHETKEPIYFTVNGRGDTVLLSLTQFNEMQEELQLLSELMDGENDVLNGKIKPIKDSFDEIRKILVEGK